MKYNNELLEKEIAQLRKKLYATKSLMEEHSRHCGFGSTSNILMEEPRCPEELPLSPISPVNISLLRYY